VSSEKISLEKSYVFKRSSKINASKMAFPVQERSTLSEKKKDSNKILNVVGP
jgi:hypothetical protein